jgi:hypothetical protein
MTTGRSQRKRGRQTFFEGEGIGHRPMFDPTCACYCATQPDKGKLNPTPADFVTSTGNPTVRLRHVLETMRRRLP